MKLLICGAGKIAAELLQCIGERWEVTLVEQREERLQNFLRRYRTISRTVAGDASSPVVLEKAGVADQHFVLALTGDDPVNLAAVTFARACGVRHTLSLVSDPANAPQFESQNARPLLMTSLLARKIYHYLQDPRVNVTAFHQGQAEVLELEVGPEFSLPGDGCLGVGQGDWRVVGFFRNNVLMFPDAATRFQAGDRLVILGQAGVFQAVSSLLEFHQPHFPRAYGRGLILAVPEKGTRLDAAGITAEARYLAGNIKVQEVLALSHPDALGPLIDTPHWAERLDVRIESVADKFFARLEETCRRQSTGLILLPELERSLLGSLTRPGHTSLAHAFGCPLLICRYTFPYDRILVPFNGSLRSEQALAIAIDLARQLEARVCVAVVEEPAFIHTESPSDPACVERLLAKTRDIAHVYKFHLEEILLRGNPVTEVTRIAEDFQLMVVGITHREKRMFSPQVGELMVRRSPCSVLIITG